MDQSVVIDKFIALLRELRYPGLKIERVPDEDNRTTPDIDAIAGHLAIEHTSVDSLPDQRRNIDRYTQITEGLEGDSLGIPFYLRLVITCESVATGQDSSAIREVLRHWVLEDSHRLPDGDHPCFRITGVPFEVHVHKSSSVRPGMFVRWAFSGERSLDVRLGRLIDRKAKKLARYKSAGKTTILLVENDDIQLMNDTEMAHAIGEAFPDALPAPIDELWYADTSFGPNVMFFQYMPKLRQFELRDLGDV